MASASAPGSRHFTLQELAKGVYAAIAVDGAWAICNAGIVDLGDQTLVFDTFVNQEAASDLRLAAEVITGKPVAKVINSHWHSDHIKGNQSFPGAQIISTGKTFEVMAKMRKRYDTEAESIRRGLEKDLEAVLAGPDGPDKVLDEGYKRGHLAGLPTFRYTLPNLTFEDRMPLDGRAGKVEAFTYGGGHTVSDVILHLPEERIVFPGDLLFINYQPYLADGNPEELLRILDRVEALDAKILVPGHGPVGEARDIASVKDYVLALQRIVKETRASGGSTSDAESRPIPSPFDSWKWHSFYRENLEFLLGRNP